MTQTAKMGFAAAAIVGSLATLVIGVVVSVAGGGKEPPRPVSDVPRATSRPSQEAERDPWPECSLVRRWIADNLPLAEHVEWEKRSVAKESRPSAKQPFGHLAPRAGTVLIVARVREPEVVRRFHFECAPDGGSCHGSPY